MNDTNGETFRNGLLWINGAAHCSYNCGLRCCPLFILLRITVATPAASMLHGRTATDGTAAEDESPPAALQNIVIGIADGMSIARVWACRYSK